MHRDGLFPDLVSEFFGTLVLILMGAGVCAMTTLFATGAPGEVVMGGWTNITIGWGLGVTFGIYVAKRSNAHINPAVTLAFAALGDFPWRKVIPYSLAQLAGAFVAAAIVFINYRPAFERFDPNLEKTAGIFTTFPAFPESFGYGLLDQILGTALLLFLILAVVENAPGWLQPPLIGLVVVAIGVCFGAMHGYAINPARDLGPRLLTVVAGFPNNGLTDGTNVYWVPIVGPLVGGPLGAFIYVKCLKPYLPAREG
jgi:glycerol uptake facilitator protein